MDSLLSVAEPQLVIPVIVVVVCAILVYIFGFQKTQEPSFQHLAVLQSSGKSKANGVANKPKNQPAPSPRNTSKPKEKQLANGNAVHASSSGGAKENLKPQPPTPKAKKDKNQANVKQVDDVAEDGDWIQAVSRKDKKTRVKKEDAKSASSEEKKGENVKKSPPPASKPRPILQEIELRAKLEKEKENKKDEGAKKPKETPAKPETKVKAVEVVVEKEEPEETAKPVEKIETKAKDVKKPTADDETPKSNVAFDEVGDLWEEAKSRGAKKKRARKD